MKKTLALLFIIGACVAGFLSIRGVMPFIPIFGTSMEPVLQAGNLIVIEEIDPTEVRVDDIIVFSVPEAVREYYNYPPLVAHRVKTVITQPALVFRTKGDNTGEDPFSVRPQDIRGKVGQQIPYLGFPLLFFQSNQGLIFIIIALSLLTFYIYGSELGQGRRRIQRGVFAPVIAENRRTSQTMTQMMKITEKGMAGTQQALGSFASAIAEYAEHLKSHTSAIQGLSAASQELKLGAAEQNKILGRIAEVMGRPPVVRMEEPRPRVEEPRPRIEEPCPRAEEVEKVILKLERFDEVIHKLEHKLEKVERVEKVEKIEGVTHEVIHEVVHKVVPKVEKIVQEAERLQFPPGCFRSSQQKDTKEKRDI